MGADDQPGLDIDEHLGERRRVDERPPVGGARVVAAPDDERPALLGRLAARSGRPSRSAGWRTRRSAPPCSSAGADHGMGDVPERHLGLGVGEMLQLVVVGDVADRPDALDVRRHRVVDRDRAAVARTRCRRRRRRADRCSARDRSPRAVRRPRSSPHRTRSRCRRRSGAPRSVRARDGGRPVCRTAR